MMDDWELRYNQRKRDGGRLSAGMKIPLQRPDSPNVRLREWCGRDAKINVDPAVRSAPDLNQLGTNPYYQQGFETPSGGYQDVTQAVVNRLPTVPQPPPQQTNTNNIVETVKLPVGTPIFKALETNGFTEVTLCRSFGNLPQNWITEYKVIGKRNCYVVNPQEKHIDVARIKSNPGSLTTLVELRSANFMIGTLFVQESYLQQQNRYNGRSLMNDSVSYSTNQQQQQQRQLNNNTNGRILLAG